MASDIDNKVGVILKQLTIIVAVRGTNSTCNLQTRREENQ